MSDLAGPVALGLLGVGISAILLGTALAAAPPSPAGTAQHAKPADNSYCFACHANMKSEPLAHTHQMAGVGCATCHGESDKHSSDENNVTPPDKMYSKARIAGACIACHRTAALRRTDLRLRQPVHARSIAASAAAGRHPATAAAASGPSNSASAAKRYCTDCHGTHRLPTRTRRWDKDTGKLIKDDGVRMLK
jgi:hypothetical protein